MICKGHWIKPPPAPRDLNKWCDLVDEQEALKHRLETVNLAILRICVIEGLTLDEALALAKEGM
jgi:hypothetical protein